MRTTLEHAAINTGIRQHRQENKSKGSEIVFGVLMFAASITCIWQVASLAVSFYTHLH